MNSKKKVTISWSGGKDSAFALFKILLSKEYDVVNLHTVIDEETKRVGLHGIREKLIEAQAACIGIPLKKIYLPASENHDAYKKCMQKFYRECAQHDIDGVVFGDIFLEDLKNFRLSLLGPSKLFAVFPLWKLDSRILVTDFINTGFKTTICSANASLFAEHHLGSFVDKQFLETLSSEIDPCGENGEFHTFVFDGPLFKRPVQITKGDLVKKTYVYQKKRDDGTLENLQSTFWFQDFNNEVVTALS
jgi:uncharacterized protein (TIGR00290 family)